MDIKEKALEVVKKITSDKALMDQFEKDPVKAVEKVIGVDLPDDVVKKIIESVKAKLIVDKIDAVRKRF